MDRSSFVRWAAIAALILLFWKFGMPAIQGGDKPQNIPVESYVNAPGFAPDRVDGAQDNAAEGELCRIVGKRFEAELSTRGAALTHFWLTDAQYGGADGRFDLATVDTTEKERWRSLRTLFRGQDAADQLPFDRFPWALQRAEDGSACTFTFESEVARIEKRVAAGERPFELTVATTVKNLAAETKRHQLSIGTYAFRYNREIKGDLGRVSPFLTELSCAAGKDVVRKPKDDFKEGWFAVPRVDRYASVNNHYFAQALMVEGGEPDCQLLAEDWFGAGQARDDANAGAVYHAKLTYPARALGPGEVAEYKQTAFFGPKDREVLAAAGGGRARLNEVINLGFFSPVARVLVGALVFFQRHITFGNWGLAIILLTVGLRTLLFPLTLKSIKSTVAMRRLKPEVDALNEKFKDDAQAKNLAMMELWKKNGVNPFGGCLPQLIQMPVWFAMYTTLQTAVEMYHTKFLWFTDLSAPDRFYVLPFLLGALMIVQQRIVPMQGVDPVQQKMMTWIMPGVFTVMMLFLPAALGVYMLTNSLLGIVQQLVVERVAPRGPTGKKGEIVVEKVGDEKARKFELGKGKARV